MIFDYEIFKIIWWLLIGVLLIGFTIMDGHDMGVGMLSPIIGKTDSERRAAINTVAPHWDGNQVWFITLGGAVFAAWPLVYAASFSILYIAIIFVLWTIFLRAPAFEYRSKIDSDKWRKAWDKVLFVGSMMPPLLAGVAFGNLFLGIPFHYDVNMRLVPDASPIMELLGLLSPFGLLCGLVAVFSVASHGGVYLTLRTEGEMQERARKAAKICGIFALVLFLLGGIYVAQIKGFVVGNIAYSGESDPLLKSVTMVKGAWLNNYVDYPFTVLFPILGVIGFLGALFFNSKKRDRSGVAFVMSSLAISGVILTAGFSLFPFVFPSNTDPISSLTLWDATSSHDTLQLMFFAALIFVPIILSYTIWAYRMMRGKLSAKKIDADSKSFY